MEKEITINGVVYTPKNKNVMALNYVIIRADRAGIFAGYLSKVIEKDNCQFKEVEICQCIRIWYWDGAASISQLAIDGTSAPENCKFPEATATQTISGVIEIIPCTAKAMKSIQEVPIWKK